MEGHSPESPNAGWRAFQSPTRRSTMAPSTGQASPPRALQKIDEEEHQQPRGVVDKVGNEEDDSNFSRDWAPSPNIGLGRSQSAYGRAMNNAAASDEVSASNSSPKRNSVWQMSERSRAPRLLSAEEHYSSRSALSNQSGHDIATKPATRARTSTPPIQRAASANALVMRAPSIIADDNDSARIHSQRLSYAPLPTNGGFLNLPLCAAAERGDFKLYSKLLKKKIVGPTAATSRGTLTDNSAPLLVKASVNDYNNMQQTALHIVSTTGNVDFIKQLIKLKPDLNAHDNSGWTPLHCACNNGQLQVANILLEAGADPKQMTMSRSTALHYLMRNFEKYSMHEEPWEDCFELILKKGAKINEANEHGVTPLHDACAYAPAEVVHFLLMRGASITAVTKFDETPLHTAVKPGRLPVIKRLLCQGADPYAVSQQGSCIELADKFHSKSGLKYLLMGLKGLGTAVLSEICSYLSASQLFVLSHVCQFFAQFCTDDKLWERFYVTNTPLRKVRHKGRYHYKDLIADFYRAHWTEWLCPPPTPSVRADLHELTFKILLVGDRLCGKSNFMSYFLDEPYEAFPDIDKDLDCKHRIVSLHSKHIKLQLWELGFHKRCRLVSKAKAPYRQMNGIILMYNQQDAGSWNNLHHWVEDARRFSDNEPEMLVVGTHYDQSDKFVTESDVREFCKQEKITLFETNALTGRNVHLAIRCLTERIYARQGLPQQWAAPCMFNTLHHQ